ncbi:MAG: hypothetical protein V3V08_23025 [Nannocystaceae bacterium]
MTVVHSRILVAFALLFTLGSPPRAMAQVRLRSAQPLLLAEDDRAAQARSSYAAGERAFQTGDYVTALKRYEEAYFFAPSRHGLAYKVGLSAYRLRACAVADQYLAHFVRNADPRKHAGKLRDARVMLRKMSASGCADEALFVPGTNTNRTPDTKMAPRDDQRVETRSARPGAPAGPRPAELREPDQDQANAAVEPTEADRASARSQERDAARRELAPPRQERRGRPNPPPVAQPWERTAAKDEQPELVSVRSQRSAEANGIRRAATRKRRMLRAGYSLAAAGVVGVAGGITTFIIAAKTGRRLADLSSNGTVTGFPSGDFSLDSQDPTCLADPDVCPYQLHERLALLNKLTPLALGLGALAGASGAALLVLERRWRPDETSAQDDDDTIALRAVVPVAMPGGMGAAAMFRF